MNIPRWIFFIFHVCWRKIIYRTLLSVIFLIFVSASAFSAVLIDFENGVVFNNYNDVRIPGDGGTKFSLTDEFSSEPRYFFRFRLGLEFLERHSVSFLVAPLKYEYRGRSDRNIHFYGKDFPAGTDLRASFMFNSYRLTYRYDFYRTETLIIGAGLTGKIREAAITVEGGGQKAERSNVGFVPLVNFRIKWIFYGKFGLVLDGDALAAPQGRAEDVLFALEHDTFDNISFRVGYRILEGGSGAGSVYTFSMFSYAAAGVTARI